MLFPKKYEIPLAGAAKLLKNSDVLQITDNFLSVIDKKEVEHSNRMAYYMLRFARSMHLAPAMVNKLVLGAYFSNIGKFLKKSGDYIIDGYLFLKNYSPLSNVSKMILYQRDGFNQPLISSSRRNGLFIHLWDRFDTIYMEERNFKRALEILGMESGYYNEDRFQKLLDYFSTVDMEYIINSKIYLQEVRDFFLKQDFFKHASIKMVAMLARIFEVYNDTTLFHSQMTALIAWMLSIDLNLDKERGYKIYTAGLVHDLGKVFIPIEIIEKPGKLTDSEYEVMKTHVSYTKKLLDFHLASDIVEISYRHHERLNGSGYPNHIEKKNMTIDQMILQVADVASALIARRSYKEPMPKEKVIAILLDNVEKNLLSKDVVDAFIKNADVILEIINLQYEEELKKRDDISIERESLLK